MMMTVMLVASIHMIHTMSTPLILTTTICQMRHLRHEVVKGFAHLTVSRGAKIHTLAICSRVYALHHHTFHESFIVPEFLSHVFIH